MDRGEKGLWLAITIMIAAVAVTIAWNAATADEYWEDSDVYEPVPYLLEQLIEDAYGPGRNADGTGRGWEWQDKRGRKVKPWEKVTPDVYGPGIGSDPYGRPVRGR